MSSLLDFVFGSLAIFVEHPLAAFIPAAAFLGLYYARRRKGILVAGICWAAYATLETLNWLRITCSGECNIRVDLLVIYPVLWIVSLIAVVALFLPGKPRAAA